MLRDDWKGSGIMRLIDADKLKKHYAWWEDDRQELFDSIADQQPTVDAEPVTRCAQCVWYVTRQMKYDGTLDKRYKPTWCELWRAEMKGNDYCSRGERK